MDKILIKPPKQVLLFMIQDTYACIDLLHINKVLPLPLLEIVPGTPKFLAGLMNLSGKSIPVIDLALRMELDRKEPYSLDTPILLCADNSHQAGIIVDEVIGLHSVAEESLQMHDEFNTADSLFLGTLNLNSQLSMLIDIKKLLDVSYTLEKIKQDVSHHLIRAAKSHL